MIVREVEPKDAAQWLEMRCLLWPDGAEDHEAEIRAYFVAPTEPLIVFVAEPESEKLAGFVEVNIRNYAEDCESNNVGYIEGWFVRETCRRQDIGRALVKAAEDWARAQGCIEMASDCVLDNEVSLAAHLALNYEETVRLICFRKSL